MRLPVLHPLVISPFSSRQATGCNAFLWQNGRAWHSGTSRFSAAIRNRKRPGGSFLEVTHDPCAGTDFEPNRVEIRRSRSQIRSIRSFNVGGAAGQDDGKVSVSFENGQDLVAVTGETGAGKSLLIAKALDLVTGGKASATLFSKSEIQDSPNEKTTKTAYVEADFLLAEPHFSFVRSVLDNTGSANYLRDDAMLRLKRTLVLQPQQKDRQRSYRLKSICEINNKQVTLKTLTQVARPLVALVDAATGAAAMARPEARIAILDTAISPNVLDRFEMTKREYRTRRKHRERLEKEIASMVLPQSLSLNGGDEDMVLLDHWIEELDAFESRVADFCTSCVVADEATTSGLASAAAELAETSWMQNAALSRTSTFSSLLLERLTDFRNTLDSLETQLVSCRSAYDALASLSSTESAATAIERARRFLFDAAGGDTTASGRLAESVERSHELLNVVEAALKECSSYIDDEEAGLIHALEAERSSCRASVDEVDNLLLDWGVLARKHGVPPHGLPACHAALRNEQTGNIEAKKLLPDAITRERSALLEFEDACQILSRERKQAADALSLAVSEKLPSLGMEKSKFQVVLTEERKCTDASVYSGSGVPGVDSASFTLLHGSESAEGENGGELHQVGSSGEKARILLAVECALPGSVGACCRASGGMSEAKMAVNRLAPIAVVYDEIDAHVGGHASVAMAGMLALQSQSQQVLAITHSPSVAAIADSHVVVRRHLLSNSIVGVTLTEAKDEARRRELARMASGDLASEEALVFADALIRDGRERRIVTTNEANV